jgi:hypothetical protein
MQKILTTVSASILLTVLLSGPAGAQPVRNGDDVVWARDVAGATFTLDGVLDEPNWAQASAIPLVWNQEHGAPGDGQKIEGNPIIADPLDGNNGTLYVLRDGNTLWMGLEVEDQSIGGGRGLQAGNWNFDGFIMAMLDRSELALINYNDANSFVMDPAEWIYGWWNPSDTLTGGLPIPGGSPRFFGNYGVGFGDKLDAERSPEKEAVLNWAWSVDGTANDDSHGDDTGYTLEWAIDVGLMGYDFTSGDGDRVAFGFALQDADWYWPYDEDKAFVSRVWFQNQWANNFEEGVAYIYGAPGVTVLSPPPPAVTEPEFHIPNAGTFGAPTLDGALDEAAWAELDTVITMQYQASPETMALNKAEVMKYYHRWFRPGINGQTTAVVVDPSTARVKMFFEGDMLYIGVDVNDQAISGIAAEGGRDGIRFTMRQVDSLQTDGTMHSLQFDVSIDSTGAVVYQIDALNVRLEDETAFQAAVAMKGASTPADPTDIDEGYTIEIAMDLTKALGYPSGLGDGRLWLSANFFDGDFLESLDDSYATRVWSPGERAQEASVYAWLNPNSAVAVRADDTLPARVTLEGNFPNPFNPTTTLRFGIPESGQVTLYVYDVLGRQVRQVAIGAQAAGSHEVAFQSAGLASGMYLYRIRLEGAGSGRASLSDVGRMILLK